MRKRLSPQTVICYSSPYEEMQGNIIVVPYEGAQVRKEKVARLNLTLFGGTYAVIRIALSRMFTL